MLLNNTHIYIYIYICLHLNVYYTTMKLFSGGNKKEKEREREGGGTESYFSGRIKPTRGRTLFIGYMNIRRRYNNVK